MIRTALASIQQAVIGLPSVFNDGSAMSISAHVMRSQQQQSHNQVLMSKPSREKREEINKQKRKHSLPSAHTPKIDLTATTTYNGSSWNADFNAVATSGTGQYVAVLTETGAYVSSNYGKTYAMATTPIYESGSIAIASSSPQYMIMGCFFDLYVSTNHGTTFSSASVSTPPTFSDYGSVGISGNGQYAYAVAAYTNSPLYSSSNYLSSFSKSTSPTDTYQAVTVSLDGSTVYAISTTTMYKHSTSGSTWTTLNPGITSLEFVATNTNGQYVAVASYSYLYVSNNYGADGSWTLATSSSGYYYPDSVVMSSTGQYLYVITGFGIYSSSNYGASVTLTQAPPVDYNAVAVTSSGNTVVAVSSEGSIYQTTNSGNTWTPNHYNWAGVAMSQNGQTIFATALYFGFMTTNSGSTWLQTGYNDMDSPVIACDSSCQHMIMATNAGGYAYITSDYGQTWNSYYIGEETSSSWFISAVAISSTGQYMSAAMDDDNIYVSSNYGKTWKVSNSVVYYWVSIAMSYSGQYQIATGTSPYTTSGAIFVSSDYGSTWSQSSTGSMYYYWTSVSSDSTGKNLVAASTTVVYYSNDYGSSWNLASTSSSSWTSCAVSSSGQSMYVASSTGVVYASFNYGSTWAKLTSVPVWNYNGIACDSTGQQVTLVAYSGPVLRSTNSGSTWTAQSMVFSTTNAFGVFTFTWDWFWDDDFVVTLATGAIVGIVVGGVVCCCCIAALIGFCFFGLCQKKSILKEEEKTNQSVEIEMDKI